MITNILAIRNDRFGEFLLNIPAILALRSRYPQAKLTLAVNSTICELAKLIDCVEEVVVWNEVKCCLRNFKFDICVILNSTKEAHWAVFSAGIPIRVGYDRKWGFLLTHKLKDTKALGDRHEVDCNLELVELLGVKSKKIASSGYALLAMTDALNKRFEYLAGAIAIHPFTSDLVKQWPIERFKELAQRINRELGVKVVMVGLNTEKEKEIASAPTVPRNDKEDACPRNDKVGVGIVNMINKISLVELAALLKRCVLLVSGDSGPVHLAAAVGTPVIALFRNDLPGKTAKRWGPWGEGHAVIEKSRLEDISVDEVFEKVKLGLLRRPTLSDSSQ